MKRFLRLSIVLWLLIILSCKTVPEQKKITLPPMPEREELKPVSSVKDMAEIIIKQEALIESWESWGKNVKELIDGNGPDGCN